MSGLMRDPKISLLIDEKWRSAVLPVDDLEINSDFIPNEGIFYKELITCYSNMSKGARLFNFQRRMKEAKNARSIWSENGMSILI